MCTPCTNNEQWNYWPHFNIQGRDLGPRKKEKFEVMLENTAMEARDIAVSRWVLPKDILENKEKYGIG